ncbi:MAG: holo-ACP synthase [Eubacteriales bacterium]
MIIGIGTDLVEIERVEKACQKQSFYTRCFSIREQKLINNNWTKAAGNWAVKESVGKSFGTGISGFALTDIEVLRNQQGKPYVELSNRALELSKQLEVNTIHVTISNTKSYAMAYVIAEK